jgi:hypothetical protein
MNAIWERENNKKQRYLLIVSAISSRLVSDHERFNFEVRCNFLVGTDFICS